MGAVDEFFSDWAAGVAGADIVVVCTPVDAIAATVRELLPHLKPGAVVTDAGSVKAQVAAEVQRVIGDAGSSAVFVGGHPMAGAEKTGAEHARADLYRGATVVLTPDKKTSRGAVAAVERLWRDAGAKTVRMDARTHDRIVAATSHLPHLLAFDLSLTVDDLFREDPRVAGMVAGSFRDMTRIADSDPRSWAAIAGYNREELGCAIDGFIERLLKARKHLLEPVDMEKKFRKARSARQNIIYTREGTSGRRTKRSRSGAPPCGED